MTSPVIDVHSHATFDAGDGLDAGLGVPIDKVPPWSDASSIELMDSVGISVSILSMPEAGVHFDTAKNRQRARQVNEFLVGLRAETPDRRGAMAVLPALDTDDALAELAYALDDLEMDAVSLPASMANVYLGDPSFDPIFAELDRRAATLFVHPTLPPADQPLTLGLNQSILEFPFDTTRLITNLILHGTMRRFPDVKIITSHGGGTFPFLVTRLQTLIPEFGSGPAPQPLTPEQIAADAALLYYDVTAATSDAQLTALVDLVPSERLLMGFDIPYMPSESMAPALEAVRTWSGFTDRDRENVLFRNAESLFPSVAARLTAA